MLTVDLRAMTKPEHEELLERSRRQSDALGVLSRVADDQRREAIHATRDAGMTFAEIGRALGISTGRVSQILSDTR